MYVLYHILYLFNVNLKLPQVAEIEDDSRIERRHWGEIASDEDESDEESDIEDEEEQTGGKVPAHPPEGGYVTPAPTEG